MKKFWTFTKIIIIVVFIAISSIGPFVINELYRGNSGYMTLWGADEVFNFWGEVVGAGATVLALIYTIMYTEYQRIAERKEMCKPHLSTVMNVWQIADVGKKEWNYDYAILLEKDGKIQGLCDFPPIIKKIQMFDNTDKKLIDKEISKTWEYNKAKAKVECLSNYIVIEYFIKNVGMGTALGITFFVDKKKTILPFSLIPAEEKRVLLVCNLEKLEKNTTWNVELQFDYYNVYKDSEFIQNELFQTNRNEEGNLGLTKSVEQTLSSPIEKYIKM